MGKRYLIDSNTLIEFVGRLLPIATRKTIGEIINQETNKYFGFLFDKEAIKIFNLRFDFLLRFDSLLKDITFLIPQRTKKKSDFYFNKIE